MAEPQLSVRSEKARSLARELSERTGRPINAIVEEALADFKKKLAAHPRHAAWGQVWKSADAIAESAAPGVTSDHSDLYDEDGLPK